MKNKSWINIEEQIPPTGKGIEDSYYWTLNSEGVEDIFWWDQTMGDWHNEYGDPDYDITHWQPIQKTSSEKNYTRNEVMAIIEWIQNNYRKVEDEMAGPYEDNDIEGLPDDFFEQAYKEALKRAFENYDKR